MKAVHLVGARPQFIKLAALMGKLKGFSEVLVHSGQHYDYQMSQVFFDTLGIRKPDYHLGVGSGSHAEQTGKAMIEFEKVCIAEKPAVILIYGDCNTTLAGALVGAKLQIQVAHVEAGVRSYDWSMPEEFNRVLADHCSSLLFAPTAGAVENLGKEGIIRGVHNVGDIMYDSFLKYSKSPSNVMKSLSLKPGFVLVTLHRPSNVDSKEKLAAIFGELSKLEKPVVFPMHPRTRKSLERFGIPLGKIKVIEPVGYVEMLGLERESSLIITDSGGVQREAYFSEKPCIVLRDSTEWPELLGQTVVLLKNIRELKVAASRMMGQYCTFEKGFFGDGKTGEKIAGILRVSIK